MRRRISKAINLCHVISDLFSFLRWGRGSEGAGGEGQGDVSKRFYFSYHQNIYSLFHFFLFPLSLRSSSSFAWKLLDVSVIILLYLFLAVC